MNQETADRDDMENLVRDYLHGQESAVDAQRTLAGVRLKMSVQAHDVARPLASRVFRLTARWLAVAAAVLLVTGFTWTFRQATAHAAAIKLVREARHALVTAPRDRAYRIRINLAPGMAGQSLYLAALATFDCRLWTRSDRFWIEGRQAARVWAFGRDEQRRVWVAPTAKIGLNFAPEDVPEPMDDALDLFTFDLDTVLRLLSNDFDVRTLSQDTGSDPGVTRIRGTPRPEHPRPRLRSITVEIDEQTKSVRQVVLARMRDGQDIGEVSFTFDQAENQTDSAYQLSTHIAPGAVVYGPDRRSLRRRELVRFFGSLLLKKE